MSVSPTLSAESIVAFGVAMLVLGAVIGYAASFFRTRRRQDVARETRANLERSVDRAAAYAAARAARSRHMAGRRSDLELETIRAELAARLAAALDRDLAGDDRPAVDDQGADVAINLADLEPDRTPITAGGIAGLAAGDQAGAVIPTAPDVVSLEDLRATYAAAEARDRAADAQWFRQIAREIAGPPPPWAPTVAPKTATGRTGCCEAHISGGLDLLEQCPHVADPTRA